VIAVTHARILIDVLHRSVPNGGPELSAIELVKEFGETVVSGPEAPAEPSRHWPKR